MDYNKSLKDTICPFIIDEIISKVASNSQDWTVKVDGWKLKYAKEDYDYFKNHGLTCQAELVINYSIYRKSGGPVTKETASIFIPQMVKSSFVIQGKTRTHESYFDKDRDLDVQAEYISFQGVTYRDKDKAVNIYIKGVGNDLVPIDQIDDEENFKSKDFYEMLNLTDRQRKKIHVMYGFEPGPRITSGAIDRMMKGFMPTMRDHLVTKQLVTVDRALFLHLRLSARKVIRIIDGQFYKNGGLYLTSLQTAVSNFFKGRSESVNPVKFPDNMNEVSYLIASKKVVLETGSKGEIKVAKTNYNESFFDVVDASVTPDNKEVNRSNELAQAVEVESDGTLTIKVMDKKTYREVTLDYLDYALAKVLYYADFDYVSMKLLNPKGPWRVKYRGELFTVENFDEVDYIDLHADARLATTTRLIPMASATDSVRKLQCANN